MYRVLGEQRERVLTLLDLQYPMQGCLKVMDNL
jgi:hypothetical protein